MCLSWGRAMKTADQRIDDLEARLSDYHEWLVNSIEARDRLAIDAAWGVHSALYSALGTLAAIYEIHRDIGEKGWLGPLLIVIACTLVPFAIHIWSNNERMKEVDRFAKLPEWTWKDAWSD